MKNFLNIKKISFERILIAILFFCLGYLSFSYINIGAQQAGKDNMDLFWNVWGIMDKKFPFESPDSEQKIYGAISGLVESYNDEYSRFLSPVETEYFDQNISGEFGGIGAEIGVRNGLLTIINPLKDSPAERFGIQARDIITQIDGKDVSKYSLDTAITKIRGKIDTEVTLTIFRNHEGSFDITLPREKVTIPILKTDSNGGTFIIHLDSFNDGSEQEFTKALEEFKDSGMNRLLIDLRNNPGGYLGAVVEIASHFLPQGFVVVREESNKDKEIIYRSKGYDTLKGYNFDMAILTNNGSASASEILAGALRDHLDTPILGETTYGKGSVQELIELDKKTALKVTVAHWLTPHGDYISKNGIEPDIIIEPEHNDFFGDNEDKQLIKALESF